MLLKRIHLYTIFPMLIVYYTKASMYFFETRTLHIYGVRQYKKSVFCLMAEACGSSSYQFPYENICMVFPTLHHKFDNCCALYSYVPLKQSNRSETFSVCLILLCPKNAPKVWISLPLSTPPPKLAKSAAKPVQTWISTQPNKRKHKQKWEILH